MARVIAVCNQKGGVGKTTSVINIGSYLAMSGKKVLIVDFDPQGNATSGLGTVAQKTEAHIYHGIFGRNPFEEIVRGTPIFNLHLIPSNQNLSGALVELVQLPEREFYLRKFINRVRHNYDYVLIDLPPSLSLLTLNGLVAADEVLMPIQAEYYSLEGLGQLLETVGLINRNLQQDIEVAGAFLTMYDKRARLSREVAKEVRRHFPYHVFEVEIPRCVSLAEAPSFGKPIALYSPFSAGATAYERLAGEILSQENKNNF